MFGHVLIYCRSRSNNGCVVSVFHWPFIFLTRFLKENHFRICVVDNSTAFSMVAHKSIRKQQFFFTKKSYLWNCKIIIFLMSIKGGLFSFHFPEINDCLLIEWACKYLCMWIWKLMYIWRPWGCGLWSLPWLLCVVMSSPHLLYPSTLVVLPSPLCPSPPLDPSPLLLWQKEGVICTWLAQFLVLRCLGLASVCIFFLKFLYCASFHSRPRVLEFLEFIRLFLCSPLIHSFATDSEGSWSVRLTALCVVDFIFTDWLWKLLPGRTECFPRCVFRVGRPSTPNLS